MSGIYIKDLTVLVTTTSWSSGISWASYEDWTEFKLQQTNC